ncbi:MAG: sulfur carrier protein ThiS [Planctomycetota bacterium]|nr:sulfur carrier protein ThiS [Planctomycetota bacterium]
MMAIQVNGEACEVAAGTTLVALIAARGLEPQQVATEVNLELVPREDRDGVVLAPGDRIELVTMVGGG